MIDAPVDPQRRFPRRYIPVMIVLPVPGSSASRKPQLRGCGSICRRRLRPDAPAGELTGRQRVQADPGRDVPHPLVRKHPPARAPNRHRSWLQGQQRPASCAHDGDAVPDVRNRPGTGRSDRRRCPSADAASNCHQLPVHANPVTPRRANRLARWPPPPRHALTGSILLASHLEEPAPHSLDMPNSRGPALSLRSRHADSPAQMPARRMATTTQRRHHRADHK